MILAAGRGRRFEPLSEREPKALLPVLGVPLLAHHLSGLAALGVREAVLVSGHLGERLRAFAGDGSAFGLRVTHVTQDEPLGIAHALACARGHVTRPFVCLLGDLWFPHTDLAGLLRSYVPGCGGVLGVRAGDGEDELARNYEVCLGSDGAVAGVREKPPPGPGLRGIGVYVFPAEFLAVASSTPRSALRGERELTDAIQRHLEAGARVLARPFEQREFNLSAPADLLAANRVALARSGARAFVHSSARLGAGVRLEEAVVGAGARVADGAVLRRVVVFGGEVVPPGVHEEVVFAAGLVVSAVARR